MNVSEELQRIGLDRIVEMGARVTPQWLAGFFDGEGCVSIHKAGRTWSVRVDITQNDPVILTLITIVVGSGKVNAMTHNKCNNTYYRVYWAGKDTLPLLHFVKEHVIRKRVQVEAAIEFATLSTHAGGRLTEDNVLRRGELAKVVCDANARASNSNKKQRVSI